MSTSPQQSQRAKLLHQHLASLYRFACSLEKDSAHATAWVEETCHRAIQQPADVKLSRSHLFRMLLEEHDKRDRSQAASDVSLTSLHRRLATKHLRRVLPSAFATLGVQNQLLLLLLIAEHFSVTEASHILDVTPERIQRERNAAFDTLRTYLLRVSTTTEERELLERHLSDDMLEDALDELLATESTSLPTSLHETVAKLTTRPERSSSPPRASSASKRSRTNDFSSSSTSSTRTGRLLTVLLFVVMIGSVGLLTAHFLRNDTETQSSLVTYSVQQAPSLTPTVRTGDGQRAERIIQRKLGRHLSIPAIDSMQLTGLSLQSLGAAQVPILLYKNERTQETLPVYVYNYSLLDQLRKEFDVSNDLLERLRKDTGFAVQHVQDQSALLWRNRDDIFLAVTADDVSRLRHRLSPAQE